MKKLISVICAVVILAASACPSFAQEREFVQTCNSAEESAFRAETGEARETPDAAGFSIPTVTSSVYKASFSLVSDVVVAGDTSIEVRAIINPRGEDISNFTIDISYDDSKVSISDFDYGDLDGMMMTSQYYNKNPYKIVYADLFPISFGDNLIGTFTFDLKSPAKAGDFYRIDVSVDSVGGDDGDINLNNVLCNSANITVLGEKPRELSGIEVFSTPHKLNYKFGEALDLAGAVILLNYTDGSTELVSSGFSISGYNALSVGEQYLILTYKGFTTSFKVNVYQPGDANRDGLLTIADAADILKYVAGWGIDIDRYAAEVTGDGEVTITDAAQILKKVAGWVIELK